MKTMPRVMARGVVVASSCLAVASPAPLAAVAASLPCQPAPGVNDACPTWTATYQAQPPGTDAAHAQNRVTAMRLSPRGDRVFVTGWSLATDGQGQGIQGFATVAYDLAGRRLWARWFHLDGTVGDEPTGVAVSPSGDRVFVTGGDSLPRNDEGGIPDAGHLVVIAYDAATGRQLWETHTLTGWPAALALAPDGRSLYVTGSTRDPARGARSYITAAFDPQGGRLRWAAQHPGSNSGANGLAVAPDGRHVYVTGFDVYGGDADPRGDYLTIAYETGSGRPAWTMRYRESLGRFYTGSAVATSHDGATVYVTGTRSDVETNQAGVPHVDESTLGGSARTVAYDARSGAQLWATGLPAPAVDSGLALAVSPADDRLVVTGSTALYPALRYETTAFDAHSGAVAWTALYGTPSDSIAMAASVAYTPDGSRVYVSGTAEDPGMALQGYSAAASAIATVAYDAASGLQLFAARLDNGASNTTWTTYVGAVVQPTPDGRGLLVAGTLLQRDPTAAPPVDQFPGYPTEFALAAYAPPSQVVNALAAHPVPSLPWASHRTPARAPAAGLAGLLHELTRAAAAW